MDFVPGESALAVGTLPRLTGHHGHAQVFNMANSPVTLQSVPAAGVPWQAGGWG